MINKEESTLERIEHYLNDGATITKIEGAKKCKVRENIIMGLKVEWPEKEFQG